MAEHRDLVMARKHLVQVSLNQENLETPSNLASAFVMFSGFRRIATQSKAERNG
jgi:hypothetical protein